MGAGEVAEAVDHGRDDQAGGDGDAHVRDHPVRNGILDHHAPIRQPIDPAPRILDTDKDARKPRQPHQKIKREHHAHYQHHRQRIRRRRHNRRHHGNCQNRVLRVLHEELRGDDLKVAEQEDQYG